MTKLGNWKGEILAVLKSVQSDLATIHTEMNTLRDSVAGIQEPANRRQNSATGQPKRGCKGCQEKGMFDSCTRWF